MDSFEQASGKADAETGFAPVRRAEFAPVPADQRHWWRVECRGVDNTHRFLTVLVNRDKVVLAGPPGRTAVLEAGSAGQLSTALRCAADQARK